MVQGVQAIGFVYVTVLKRLFIKVTAKERKKLQKITAQITHAAKDSIKLIIWEEVLSLPFSIFISTSKFNTF